MGSWKCQAKRGSEGNPVGGTNKANWKRVSSWRCQVSRGQGSGPWSELQIHTPHGKLGRRLFARNEANQMPRLRVWRSSVRQKRLAASLRTRRPCQTKPIPGRARRPLWPPAPGVGSLPHTKMRNKANLPRGRNDGQSGDWRSQEICETNPISGGGADGPRSARAGRPPLGLGVRNKANSGGVSSGKCRV